MVTFSRNDCVFLEKYTTAPAPSRDYYVLKVTRNQVCIYLWKITHHTSIFPHVQKQPTEDFLHNVTMQDEIRRLFGPGTLKETLNLIKGNWDYLAHLPPNILAKILSFVDLRDLISVAATCKKLSTDISNNDELRRAVCLEKRKTLSSYEREFLEQSGWIILHKTTSTEMQYRLKPMPERQNVQQKVSKPLSQQPRRFPKEEISAAKKGSKVPLQKTKNILQKEVMPEKMRNVKDSKMLMKQSKSLQEEKMKNVKGSKAQLKQSMSLQAEILSEKLRNVKGSKALTKQLMPIKEEAPSEKIKNVKGLKVQRPQSRSLQEELLPAKIKDIKGSKGQMKLPKRAFTGGRTVQ